MFGAWPGQAWRGKARQGKARQGKARQGDLAESKNQPPDHFGQQVEERKHMKTKAKQPFPWADSLGFGTGPMEGLLCVHKGERLRHGIAYAHLDCGRILVRWFNALGGEHIFLTAEDLADQAHGWYFFATTGECTAFFERANKIKHPSTTQEEQ